MAEHGLTIAFISNRLDSKVDWFLESLNNQFVRALGVAVQILVIDYFCEEKKTEYTKYNASISYMPPLPSFAQGAHRLTKENYFDASIARNTAFVYAKYDYVAFIDDVSILGDRWLEAVLEGMREKQIILGTYQKHTEMIVENGKLISSQFKDADGDFRFRQQSSEKRIAPASWVFGCSFCIPLNKAIEVNGFDEMQAITGYEDCVFGIRLQRAGNQFYFDKRMSTIESQEHHHIDVPMKRIDPKLETREEYMKVLAKFGVDRTQYRGEFNYDASHAIIDVGHLAGSFRSHCNGYDIKDLRNILAEGREITVGDMNFPERFWFTNQLLKEM